MYVCQSRPALPCPIIRFQLPAVIAVITATPEHGGKRNNAMSTDERTAKQLREHFKSRLNQSQPDPPYHSSPITCNHHGNYCHTWTNEVQETMQCQQLTQTHTNQEGIRSPGTKTSL